MERTFNPIAKLMIPALSLRHLYEAEPSTPEWTTQNHYGYKSVARLKGDIHNLVKSNSHDPIILIRQISGIRFSLVA
jgi:hypothetical protein